MVEFSCLSFPPAATVPSIQNVEDQLVMCQPCPLIDLYDPPGIPLKPNLVSFSKVKSCASDRCD